jgi:hypothetical protein
VSNVIPIIPVISVHDFINECSEAMASNPYWQVMMSDEEVAKRQKAFSKNFYNDQFGKLILEGIYDDTLCGSTLISKMFRNWINKNHPCEDDLTAKRNTESVVLFKEAA